MPTLTVEGYGTFEVVDGKRLVLAIEQDAGGRYPARLRRQRALHDVHVEFIEGEPTTHTLAEQERLAARGLTGVRLSCQILCDHDMAVRAISRLEEGSGRPDPGGPPAETITPPAQWV